MMRRLGLLLLLSICALPAAAGVVAPDLPLLLAEEGEWPVWIYFVDKGELEHDPAALATAASRLSARTLARRAKVGAGPSWSDLPNSPAYLSWLREHGFEIRSESRWLAAVSLRVRAADLAVLADADFIRRIEALRPSTRVDARTGPPLTDRASGRSRDPIDYGASVTELNQVNVPAVHETGNHGEGVVIGMLDTGFNTGHEALQSVNVLGAWDFINDDGEVANEAGDGESQQNHGTMTLSTIGGYMPGSLVGPAFGASFYLAKTEDTSQEEPIEEDWWVEGIEWLEAQGCDLVSSSLAYDDWYVFDDFDGNTAVTTIAADQAVALGMAVINSAGNYRQGTGHIAAPADGDSVIAVGAVDSEGEVAGFSSPGPTADGRIKPDISAMGVSNNVVVPGTLDQYQTASGTSFACPLSAGVAALLFSAHPGATPMQVRQALVSTASQYDAPDNDYGWGILDAAAAVAWLQLTAAPESEPVAAAGRLLGNWPNPFNPSTSLAFSLDRPAELTLSIHDVRGRRVRRLAARSFAAGSHSIEWDGRDDEGNSLPSAVYLAELSAADWHSRGKLLLLK
jgi:serine protease AprX